jgi:hypothetical protein
MLVRFVIIFILNTRCIVMNIVVYAIKNQLRTAYSFILSFVYFYLQNDTCNAEEMWVYHKVRNFSVHAMILPSLQI